MTNSARNRFRRELLVVARAAAKRVVSYPKWMRDMPKTLVREYAPPKWR